MSMDRCFRCDAYVDTDFDLDCYLPDPNKPTWDICICERCREREENEAEKMGAYP